VGEKAVCRDKKTALIKRADWPRYHLKFAPYAFAYRASLELFHSCAVSGATRRLLRVRFRGFQGGAPSVFGL